MFIKINDRDIEYEIIRKNVKNITLRIKNNGAILITVNNRISQKRIEGFLIEKKDWILKVLTELEGRTILGNSNDRIQDKEIVLLGKKIKIVVEQGNHDRVRFVEDVLYVRSKDLMNRAKLNELLERWILDYTKEVVVNILNEIYKKFIPYNVPYPRLKLRKMKTRWGTCSIHTNTITINTLLIHTNRESIEYVVAHELMHFLHGNHSRDFYNSLSLVMPDHAVRRKRLKDYSLT